MKNFREATERVRSLATAEESKLLGKLNVWAGRVTRVALLTGMRQGELLGLRKTSVDLQHGTLALTDTKNREPRVVFFNDQAAGLVCDAIAAARESRIRAATRFRPGRGPRMSRVGRCSMTKAR